MPKRGDVVLYQQGDKTYNALVLQAHSLNDTHLGENKEPQLHLSVLFDDPIDTSTGKPKVMPVGYIPAPVTVHDVVHASHEFDQTYFLKYGADAHKNRGAGEWRGVPVDTLKRENADLKKKLAEARTGEQAAEAVKA